MASWLSWCLRVGTLLIPAAAALPFAPNESALVTPFEINVSAGVPRMMELIRDSELPDEPQYPGIEPFMGIGLDVLKDLRQQWLTDFDWEQEQAYLNSFNHYTVTVEGLTIHFIHHRSEDADAIPLLLMHGWPGSFLEFLPVIRPLASRSQTESGKPVSFNVVVPSLPGFAFSSSTPGNWSTDDTGRVLNRLMTEVLGYEHFAIHGNSNGGFIGFGMFDRYNSSIKAGHFPVLPFYATTTEELEHREVQLTPTEQFLHERSMEWTLSGTGYVLMHVYKPNTVGLGLYDHPVGQLAWMGEKWISWADERAGQAPSVLTHDTILRSASLTFLTGTFMSSLFTYPQDTTVPWREGVVERARNDAPLLISFFRYGLTFWPESILRMIGNLVQYRVHDFGGFFAGLENPPDLITDMREIGTYWKP